MSRKITQRGAAAVCFVLVVCVAAAKGEPQPAVSVEQVRAVWTQREAKVATARFEWDKRETLAKGAHNGIALARKDNRPHPPSDLVIDGKCVLCIEGGMLRYEYEGAVWSIKDYAAIPVKRIATYDGKVYKEVVSNTPHVPYPTAAIVPHATGSEFNDFAIRPLWLAVRGNQSIEKGYPLPLYETSGQVLQVATRPCLEFVKKDRGGEQVMQLFLDRDRDFLPVRYTEINNKSILVRKLEVEYQPHAEIEWVPKRWEFVSRFQTGAPSLSVACKLTSFVCNPSFPEGTFDAAIPPKSHVTDLTTGKERQYVIQPDGQKGKAVEVDRKPPSYEELAAAGPEVSTPRALWVVVAIVVGVTLIAFLVLWFQWRGGSHAHPRPQQES
ncbi:unnamed protein product [Gemmata massiliana]|uniref:Uncharacterized protein n=1 Tax=Gemmata massiliana TaxID=1210884 RepID=A0A6P2CVC3_9BACT|nr:hypothetical protein [Gemmata massiliana]VTR91052.1 unnamed protein product [Gemmata massiliana]